jgi:outer membrane immunogenic protein
MKKVLALVLAGVSAAGFAVPAVAQDESVFTGPRGEFLLGYDFVRPGSSEDIDNGGDIDQTIEGAAYGVGLGYDIQMGGLVVGLEGEWVQSTASTKYDTTAFTDFGVGEIEAGRDLYAGLRVGAAITPETLLYAKAGYSNASFDVTAYNAAQDTAVSNVDLDGWRVGAGVERAITDNAFLKAEYRYSNYQEGEFEAPSGLESDRFDVDLDRHTVMVGLGMRF